MDDLEKTGNLVEAVFWMLVTVVILVKAIRAAVPSRRIFFILSAAFFVFSISDIIESQTGGWWKPFWLLLMKTGCIAVFLFGFREYYRIIKHKDPS
jgi:succinate-acetate transporter protein